MRVGYVMARLFSGVAVAGLVVVGAGLSAADSSAMGTFTYGQTVLIDPAPGVCHSVGNGEPGPEPARNATDSPVDMFAGPDCTGAASVLGAGQQAFVDVLSMRFG